MKSTFSFTVVGVVILSLAFLGGCSDSNPISAFQPEIVNTTDSFEFQITGARNVTTTLSYSWTNTGPRASIDHSTATADGVGSLVIFDANGAEVYSAHLKPSGTEQAAVGVAGDWTIVVTFSDFDGTSNFRVEKL